MKLREYVNKVDENEEIICEDKDIVATFYFFNSSNKAPDPNFINDFIFTERLIDVLDIVNIDDDVIEVNLCELLENPRVVQYAKENFYKVYAAENDSVISRLLFDEIVRNLSYGYVSSSSEAFCKEMIKCLDFAYGDIEDLKVRPVADVNKLIAEAKTESIIETLADAKERSEKANLNSEFANNKDGFEI